MSDKTPIITTVTFFQEIVAALKANGEYPDILDYHCVDTCSVKEIKDTGFDVRTSLAFGANEGIYLDVYLEGDIGFYDKDVHVFPLGTFKTLGESKEDMRKMGILAAEVIFAAKDYVKSHNRELVRTGYYVDFMAGNERKSPSLWLNCEFMEDAISKTKEYLAKYNATQAVLTNCYSGKEQLVTLS